MTQQGLITQDGLPPPQRRWAIATVALAIFLTVVDQTIVNVALPTIAADLNVDASSSVWIVNAYQVAIMLSLLPLSAVGDIFGYKRVYLAGLALFGIASLGCALASSLAVLTGMRVVQGLGAAGVMSVNMALVRFIHPINRLGHGIGINAVIIAVSAAAGPTIASSILAFAPWPWLFAIKVPIAIIAVAIGIYALPETPRATHPFDAVSAILSTITFGTLIAFLDAFSRPTPFALIGAELALTLVAGFVLYRRQLGVPLPLLPVDLLRIPMFALSVSTSFFSFLAQTLAFIALPFHLQAIGYSVVDTGLLMTPWPIATAIFAPISGKLSDRYPAGLLGLLGLAAFAAGLAALAILSDRTSMGDVAWRMAIAGAGFGLYQSPNNRTIQASAPRSRSGGASGMQAMARLLGQTVGAALTALIFARFLRGAMVAVWFATGFAVIGAAVSALRLTDLPQPKD
ncbi:MAG: transporter, family, multidrug resistance protein [Alphaproteobacteria bacterium]|nr:transporter, family, multidrug resistance protein [Alphaproteobacteria bacterium]